ncbi:MAG: hypothetical protein ACOX6I_05125 [Syntrophomonadaceae bacterium]
MMVCNDDNFICMVKDAIADELGAAAMYSQMANMVDNLALKAIIAGIAGDEFGHARTWMTILAMCGCED